MTTRTNETQSCRSVHGADAIGSIVAVGSPQMIKRAPEAAPRTGSRARGCAR